MNDIHRVPAEKYGYIFGSLSPPSPPSAKGVLGHYTYIYPVQSPEAVRTRRRVAQFDPRAAESSRRRAFAGAWAAHQVPRAHFYTGCLSPCWLQQRCPASRSHSTVVCQRPRGVGCVRAGVVAYVFGVLNVLRSHVILIIGNVLFFVAWLVREKIEQRLGGLFSFLAVHCRA